MFKYQWEISRGIMIAAVGDLLDLYDNSSIAISLCTYTMNERHAAWLIEMVESDRIKKLDIVIDRKSLFRKASVKPLLVKLIDAGNGSVNIRFSDVHANICCLGACDEFITLYGSANWTDSGAMELLVEAHSSEVYHEMHRMLAELP